MDKLSPEIIYSTSQLKWVCEGCFMLTRMLDFIIFKKKSYRPGVSRGRPAKRCCAINSVNGTHFNSLNWNKSYFHALFQTFTFLWQQLAWLQRLLYIEKLKSSVLCKKFVSLSDIFKCFHQWKHDSVSVKIYLKSKDISSWWDSWLW